MSKNKIVFITSLVLIGVIFIGSVIKGKNQISERKEDFGLYYKAEQNIEQGIDLAQAIKDIESIEDKYVHTAVVELKKTTAYQKMLQFDKVIESLDKAFELSSKLETNANLLMIYAESAYENKDKDKAKDTLEKVRELELTKEEKEKLEKLTKKIG